MGGAGVSALIEVMRSESVMGALRLKFLTLPAYWDEFIYTYVTPKIMGSPLKDLTIRWDTSIVMMGTGGLMNMKTAMSILLGAFVNYFILAPIMIDQGVIPEAKFKAITMWASWGGAAMMTTSSLYSFFSKPQILIESFKKLFVKKANKKKDVLEEVELPMWVASVDVGCCLCVLLPVLLRGGAV